MFGIENINKFSTLSKNQIDRIVKLVITQFNPLFLSLVDYKFFLDESKAKSNKIPWTGCITYISNNLYKNELPTKFRIQTVEKLGYILYTENEELNDTYAMNKELALELEQFLIENNIKIKR